VRHCLFFKLEGETLSGWDNVRWDIVRWDFVRLDFVQWDIVRWDIVRAPFGSELRTTGVRQWYLYRKIAKIQMVILNFTLTHNALFFGGVPVYFRECYRWDLVRNESKMQNQSLNHTLKHPIRQKMVVNDEHISSGDFSCILNCVLTNLKHHDQEKNHTRAYT
jgi:hypothetical protein